MTTKYRITKQAGYECLLEVNHYEDYIHVAFYTVVLQKDNATTETRKQFEMFLAPQELHRLITALTMSQYDWRLQHNTQREKL